MKKTRITSGFSLSIEGLSKDANVDLCNIPFENNNCFFVVFAVK